MTAMLALLLVALVVLVVLVALVVAGGVGGAGGGSVVLGAGCWVLGGHWKWYWCWRWCLRWVDVEVMVHRVCWRHHAMKTIKPTYCHEVRVRDATEAPTAILGTRPMHVNQKCLHLPHDLRTPTQLHPNSSSSSKPKLNTCSRTLRPKFLTISKQQNRASKWFSSTCYTACEQNSLIPSGI